MNQVRAKLYEMSDPAYQEFTSKLITTANPIAGVRLPELKRLAKTMAQKGEIYQADPTDPQSIMEEIMLEGLIIGDLKEDPEVTLRRVRNFLPKIDNWSVCDSFCANLKLARKVPDKVWEFITPYFADDRAFPVRFAVVMTLDHFVDTQHLPMAFAHFDAMRSDAYYVQMAVAWAISVFYVHFPNETTNYLSSDHLPLFTHNKALQKICESRRVTQTAKTEIRKLKK